MSVVAGWVVRIYEWCLLCTERACAEAGNPLCVRCTADVQLEVERVDGDLKP